MANKQNVSMGTGRKTVKVEAARLEHPPLAGFANAIGFVRLEDFMELTFLERREEGTVVIGRFLLPLDDLIRTIWPQTVEFYNATRDKFPRRTSSLYEVLTTRSDDWAANPGSVANFLGIARHGVTCSFDFYYITPRSMVRVGKNPAATGKDLEFLPLASVQVPTELMIRWLDQLAELIMPTLTELEQRADYQDGSLRK